MKPEILTYIHEKPIYRRSIELLPYNKALSNRAKALRKAGVLSEVIFWRQVRNDIFWSIDFDRQRIILFRNSVNYYKNEINKRR